MKGYGVNKMKRLTRFGIAFIVLLLLAVLGVVVYLQHKTPNRDQEIIINGLDNKVDVIYDDFGVPHIYAQSDQDMYRAFGYVHAQDRLFQMDLLRRLGEGKLAELFGEEAIKVDRLFRTIQVNRYTKHWMEEYVKTAPVKILQAIDAYLAGVNQFIKDGPTPIEFELLGVEKSLFTREDMAAVMGYTAYSFTFGLPQDLLITNLVQSLSEDYIEDLGIRWQKGSAQIPVNRKGIDILAKEIGSIVKQLNPIGIFHGSNSWVVAPKNTLSGKALLVNDPHMGFSQPSVWYEAHLVSPESEIYGHHLALIPFAFLGHNRDIAWGLTMFLNDDIDLFKETINPENANQYWAIDHWQEFELVEETIKVKDAEEVHLSLKKSRHGPIISNAFDSFDEHDNLFLHNKDQLAMWWAFYDDDNDMLAALYDLTRVKNVKQAEQAVRKIHSPGLNVMYADKQGDIAWWAAAKLVKRPAHVNSSVILDGASGKDDPLGYYDFSDNPQILNPDSGVLYSANNQPADTGIGLIPGYYMPRDRAERIAGFLYSDEKSWDADKMKSMLMDNTSPLVAKFQQVTLPILSKLSSNKDSELTNKALQLFADWQGNHDPELVAVTLFYQFKKELLRQTFKDEMGEHDFGIFEEGFLRHKTLWQMLDKQNSPWWDDIATKDITETQADIMQNSWLAMLKTLTTKFGSDIDKWQWKQSLKLVHSHPLGNVSALAPLFNVGPFEAAGGNETINNMIFKISDENFTTLAGPSTRRIVDFGDLNNSWGINPTGQSGVVLDKHYKDQALMFSKGLFRHQYIEKSDILAHKEGVLEFYPN